MKKQKIRRLFHCCLLLMLVVTMLATPVYANEEDSSAGDIAGVVTGIWNDASGQIKTICNSVVFPALSWICGIGFAIALIVSFVNYKKQHHIEVGWPIVFLIGLLFSLSASSWVWALVGA